MNLTVQRSFSGGELAPSLYARTDVAKYATGLRTCRNCIIMRHGGAQNRPGTEFVAEIKDSTKKARLVPFIYASDEAYIIEMGEQTFRFYQNGARKYGPAIAITGITQASTAVVTAVGHGLSSLDRVLITEVEGMTEVNGNTYQVVVTGTDTFELYTTLGAAVDSTGFGAYTSGGFSQYDPDIALGFLEHQLSATQYVQSAENITFTNGTTRPAILTRESDSRWSFDYMSLDPEIQRPTGTNASGTAGSTTQRYIVTAISATTGEESYAGYDVSRTINAVTKANPAVCTTSANHLYVTGDTVIIDANAGMTELAGTYRVEVLSSTTFSLKTMEGANVDSTGYGTFSGTTTVFRTNTGGSYLAAPTVGAPVTVSWTAVTGANEYFIYKEQNGVYGYLGAAQGTSFLDIGASPDMIFSPPVEIYEGPLSGSGTYPSAIGMFQQRLLLGATQLKPETTYASRTGLIKNFTKSSGNSTQDDDVVEFSMRGKQLNRIRHYLDLGELVIFTSSGEHVAKGNGDGVLTPTAINLKQYSYNGSSTLSPIVINGNALYVQEQGSIVRDLGFDQSSGGMDGYRGTDLTVFSSHLFDGHTIVDWAYQKTPNQIVWAVRDDGILVSLTYNREHELIAWHRHDTDGFIESVAAIPEGTEYRVYLIVRREINGVTKRYIERMSSRFVTEETIVDANFMDCSLVYDGRNYDDTHTMTLSGGTLWDESEELTLTSSDSFFSADDVGNKVVLNGPDGEIVRFTITGFSSDTVVTGTPHGAVEAGLQGVPVTNWSRAVDELLGLEHLEGKDVVVFADGSVVSNPLNLEEDEDPITVSSGEITLDDCYSVIRVGLPYASDIQTLDIDTSGPSLVGKKKIVTEVEMTVEKSRGIFVGSKEPPDDTVSTLSEVKIRDEESLEETTQLKTGKVKVIIGSSWNSNGRVFIRQVDPLPMSILSIAPVGAVSE